MPIQVGGVISGLETESIIERLIEYERRPIDILESRQEDYTVKLSAYSLMESKLKALDTALEGIDDERDFNVFSAVASDENIFTASASTSAAPGTLDIAITQIAESHKLKSAEFSGDEEINQFTIDGTNKYIDFSEDGGAELTATLTEGTYTTSELLVELKAQLDAASDGGANSYNYIVAYSAIDKEFIIESSDPTQLDILWGTGTNSANSAASVLGFDATDDTGALTYASDTEVGEATLHLEIGSTFTIDDTNNMIDFIEVTGGPSAELTATLTEGTYTIKELQVALETALEAETVNAIDYTVSFDAATQKFSIAENGSTLTELQLLWSSGTNAATSAASTLGFSSVDNTGAVTYTADNETATVVDITISAFDTLEDVAEAINDSDAAVTASVINTGDDAHVLSLSAQNTGADNIMNITVTDTDGNNTDTNGLSRLVFDDGVTENLTETQTSQDAIFSVDGVNGIERAANTVTDVITGVTLTLKQAHDDPVTESDSVTITRDTSTITQKLNTFVEAYNDLLDFFSEYQKKYDEEEETAGILVGDSTTNLIRNTLRSKLTETVSGISGLSQLADVGIALNQDEDPRLELDSNTLSEMLSNNFENVQDFFTQTTEGSEGLAVRLMDRIDSMLDSYDGILSARKSGISTTMGRIETKIETLEDKLEVTEAKLWTRFNSLELLLANYQTTADYLAQQIVGLQNLSNSISGG
jgi:flagellar hook-associated protein 2